VKSKSFLGLLLLVLSMGALAQEPLDVTVVVNGEAVSADPPPRLVNGRILVPLRQIFKALGATVKFEDKMIKAQRGQKVVHLSPDSNQASLDGEAVLMDVPPMLIEGATYVPLRFVALALGDTVTFDKEAGIINVEPAVAEDPIDVPPTRLSLLKGRLKQLVVGNQGAILKVRDAAGNTEVYYRGLDDRDTAPYDAEDHDGILEAVELSQEVSQWTADTIEGYEVLPKREAIAFLGMVLSIPDDAPLDPGPEVDDKAEEFLIKVVVEDKSVILRRQALLSMAVADPVDQEVLEAVLKIFETSENLWETFPVQQYFQYHADELRTLPNFATIRARVEAVNSLYTANILNYLDGKE